MRISRTRQRLLVGLGWPVAFGVGLVSSIHFLRYRMGLEIYWNWETGPILAASVLVLLPLLAFEVAGRRRS